jgi:cell division protein FtsI/penicillin-binding protein 2
MKNWRFNFIFVLFLILFATVTGRLIFIQIVKGDHYKAFSQGLHLSLKDQLTERGEIFFKGGEPLAIDVGWPLVFAEPRKIKDPESIAQVLSEVLSLDKNLVLERLQKDNLYSLIKNKLTKKEVETLESLNLEGISVREERGRYYSQEKLASQLIGFLGAGGEGQYGLEQFFDEILRGDEGLGNYQKGSDLTLTLDYNIQFTAEKLLEEVRESLKIEEGQIIVIEPDSGKIIALAHFPSFNPNQYQEYAKDGNLDIFKNKTTQELFEPGSVFKPITMAGALEEGKISPQTTYFDEGFVKIGGETIYNYGQRVHKGPQTMTNVLEKSINTGAVFVEKELGHHLFLKYVESFGFFEPTGIELQEIYYQNRELKKGRDINFATASFGQGIAMTPIQLVRAYCAIANGGKLVYPTLVEKSSLGLNSFLDHKAEEEKVLSSKTAYELTAMLVSVVENGFAKSAQVPGYFIAGKTGTAQVSFAALGIDKEGYSSEKTIQTFVGFAPAFNPQFLILIKLNNPQTRTAEYSAVPLFHDLAEYIIHYYQIPPDYE